jgi:polyphosphate kinase 2 (PPK2 family)
MVLFDRSWYNRAGVERVMGFCSPHEYLEFMRQAPEIERMLTRSGIICSNTGSPSHKASSSGASQREQDPLKKWKLSPIDKASLDNVG